MILGLIKSILGKDTTPSCCVSATPEAKKERDVLQVDTSSCAVPEKEEEESCATPKTGCCGGGCH